MRDEKLEYFVVYQREHFEDIRRYEYKTKNKPNFKKINKITIKWAIDISDFDIEIIEK